MEISVLSDYNPVRMDISTYIVSIDCWLPAENIRVSFFIYSLLQIKENMIFWKFCVGTVIFDPVDMATVLLIIIIPKNKRT